MAVVAGQPFNAFLQGRQARQQEDYTTTRNALANQELANAPTDMANRNKLMDLQIQGAQQGLDQGAANATRGGEERLLNQALSEAQFVQSNPASISQMRPEMQQRAREQLGDSFNDPRALSQWAGTMVAGISARLGKGPAAPIPQWKTETRPDGSTYQVNSATNETKLVQGRTPAKGNGITFTNADGSTVQIGGSGDGGGVGAQDLSPATKTKLQESIVTSTDQLDRLNSIGSGFDPQFLQIPGRLKAGALKIKDLAGGALGNMTPDESKFLADFSTFRAEGAKNLSAIFNQLSGAAVSPTEEVRLRKGIPNDEDSPTQWMAKYKSSVKDSSRAIMRANWALKNGIGVKSVADLSKAMPLNGIDSVYEGRANAIWQELGGNSETKAQAVNQARQEFGLGR